MAPSSNPALFNLCSRLVNQLARDRSYYEDWGSTADWKQVSIAVENLAPARLADAAPLSARASGVFRSHHSGRIDDVDGNHRENEPFTIEVSLSPGPRLVPPAENVLGQPQNYHFSGRYDEPTLRLNYVGARPNWVQSDHVRIEVPPEVADLLARAPYVTAFMCCEVRSLERS